jgi:2-polyprenyl-3-methyl-5-hydroxy-6-metoxy-1,4-benzoquinol methylase
MTKEAYEKFYNNEYRYVNAPIWTSGEKHDDFYGHERRQVKMGKSLQQKCVDFDLPKPKVVVDYGCFVGGMLEPFKDDGAETYGIEWDAEARKYGNDKGHTIVGSIEELITKGVKADLVILKDVIEHFTDLHEVERIKEIMAPGAHLYLYTPGFFRNDPNYYFQLAHTYQFCQRTLEYVMTEMGFTCIYCDEEVDAFFTLNSFEYYKVDKPGEWVEYITDQLFKPGNEIRRMPKFRGVCKFPRRLLFENSDTNLAFKYPDLVELMKKHSGDVICIGGGPSVDGELDTIKALHEAGTPIITIARMYPWCLEHGIIPEYVLSLDCSEEQEVCFREVREGTTFLLAVVSRPWIFERLKDQKVYVYSSQDNAKTKELRMKHGYDCDTVVNTGGSVAIGTIPMGMYLGFNDFHVFGLDLMFQNDKQTHSKGIAGKSVDQNIITISVKGQDVLTTPSFVDFANQTLDIVSVGHDMGCLKTIKFYGENLISKLWDCQWHNEEATNEASV